MQGLEKKAQVSVEYLLLTVFALIIVVVIFALAMMSSDQSIKARQIGESLDNLTKTADLVYALGQNNVLFTEVTWPQEAGPMSIIHKCRAASGEDGSLPGCGGGTTEADCSTTACVCTTGQAGGCQIPFDCLKYSAIKVTTSLFGAGNDYVYPSRAKLCIQNAVDPFFVNGTKYNVKVSWTDTGLVQLERS